MCGATVGFRDSRFQKQGVSIAEGALWVETTPRAWYQRIDSFFTGISLERSPFDANMYCFCEKGKQMVVILYVDDLIIIDNHEERISHTQELLCREFEMTDLGLMHFCLRIKV